LNHWHHFSPNWVCPIKAKIAHSSQLLVLFSPQRTFLLSLHLRIKYALLRFNLNCVLVEFFNKRALKFLFVFQFPNCQFCFLFGCQWNFSFLKTVFNDQVIIFAANMQNYHMRAKMGILALKAFFKHFYQLSKACKSAQSLHSQASESIIGLRRLPIFLSRDHKSSTLSGVIVPSTVFTLAPKP